MKIYLYVTDTMADYEVSYLTLEFTSRRFLQEADFEYKTTGVTLAPITTMGGFKVKPAVTITEALKDANLIILPGADTWDNPRNTQAVKEIMTRRQEKTWVAAICGASVKLGLEGYLNKISHRSNSLFQLKASRNYKGEALYQEGVEVVTDKRAKIITAGSSNGIAFTAEIFRQLRLMSAERIDDWQDYFAKHDDAAIMRLLSKI